MPDNTWQPIETAPKDGTRIVILERNGRVQIASWRSPSYWGPDFYVLLTGHHSDQYPTMDVTHWLPLPDLPPHTGV